MASLAIPQCLHVYDLKEDEPAQIIWGLVEGAEGYILERQFNQTFEQAMAGRTWENLDAEGKSWAAIEQDALTWEELEELPTLGRIWESIDAEKLTWDEIESKGYAWSQWGLLPLSSLIYRGPGTAMQGTIWRIVDDDALSWDMIQAKNRTWGEWENTEDHSGITDEIPIGIQSAIYRVAAYASLGEISEYLTGSLAPVTPIFYREDSTQLQVIQGMRYRLQINGEQLKDMDRVPLALKYNSKILVLEDFIVHNPGKQTNPGIYPYAHLQIENAIPGEVKFKCIRQALAGKDWSGCVTIMDFVANQTGLAEITLY